MLLSISHSKIHATRVNIEMISWDSIYSMVAVTETTRCARTFTSLANKCGSSGILVNEFKLQFTVESVKN